MRRLTYTPKWLNSNCLGLEVMWREGQMASTVSHQDSDMQCRNRKLTALLPCCSQEPRDPVLLACAPSQKL